MLDYTSALSKIRETFTSLKDNDLNTAYYLKVSSASLQARVEEVRAEWNKIAQEFELECEALFARKSKEYSDSSVARGERLAQQDEEYIEKKKEHIGALYVANITKGHVNFLDKVYFVAKDLLDRAEKIRFRGD